MRTVTLPINESIKAIAIVIHADGTATVYEPGDELPAHLDHQMPAPQQPDREVAQ